MSVADFMIHMFENENWTPQSICRTVSALRHFYNRSRPFDNPVVHDVIDEVMEALRMEGPQDPKQVSPIRKEHYDLIVETSHIPEPWDDPLDAAVWAAVQIALIGVMRDGMLRLGEVTKILWRHIQIQHDGSGVLSIPTSKNNMTGPPQLVYLSSFTMDAILEMKRWLAYIGTDVSPDARFIPYSTFLIRNLIKRACRQAGLEESYSGHSCRVGMSQDLAEADVGLPAMMNAGRWRNPETVVWYIRNVSVRKGAVARWYQRRDNDPVKHLGLAGLPEPQDFLTFHRARFGH